MITSIEIENLRGIRSGQLEGLTPLTILTGPNACGKSTVLDALLIGASPSPERAVGEAVRRHSAVLGGAKWLFGSSGRRATVSLWTDSEKRTRRSLDYLDWCHDKLRDQLLELRSNPPFSMIYLTDEELKYSDEGPLSSTTAFGVDNNFVGDLHAARGAVVRFVELVDLGLPIPLLRKFTEVSRTGRRSYVYELISSLVPQFELLEILVDDDDTPSLYVTSAGHSVPVGLAGDGIQAFVQLALEIAIAPEGLVLLEEPEVYQHPKAIWQSAKVLLANMRRGVQTVLTTHSLELIDALLAEASADDLEKMSVFNLMLEDGKLSSGRRAGKEIAFARQTLENDLR